MLSCCDNKTQVDKSTWSIAQITLVSYLLIMKIDHFLKKNDCDLLSSIFFYIKQKSRTLLSWNYFLDKLSFHLKKGNVTITYSLKGKVLTNYH